MNSEFDNPLTAKLVSIRTRSGDDLTTAPTIKPVKTISQRQAIQRICRRAEPPIWPEVEQLLVEAAEESDHDSNRAAWIRAILLVGGAAALSCAVIAMTL